MRELHAQRVAAIEKARLENPLSDAPPPKKKRKKQAEIPITHPEYVDTLVDSNPFLRFAFIPNKSVHVPR